MKKVFLILVLLNATVYSQVGGESIYNFLNLTSSSRQAALGSNTLTLVDDVNQPAWNPSTINNFIQNQVSVNYVNYLADISLLSISYAPYINNKIGTIHSHVSYLNYGTFISSDDEGNETGSFNAYDVVISVGYGVKIKNTDLHFGANFKYINSVIDIYSSNGLGSDIGLLFFNENNPLAVTVVVRNIGFQTKTFDETYEKLPLNISLGASYSLENVPITWHFTVDDLQQWKLAVSNPSNSTTSIDGEVTEEKINFFDNAIRHFSLGAELFPKKGFNIRLGYNFRRSKELFLTDKRTFAGLTAGFGIKFNKMKLNYSFSKYHPATNSNTFSLLINLN